MNSWICIN